jgi:hypothetical protein
MKKYFTRGLVATFIIATVFAFGIFSQSVKVSAQAVSYDDACELVSVFTSSGVIPASYANVAQAALRCPITIGGTTIPVSSPYYAQVSAMILASAATTVTNTAANYTATNPPTNTTTTTSPTLPAPINLTYSANVTSCNTADVTLSWGAVPGATSYLVRFDNPVNGYNIECTPANEGDVCTTTNGNSATHYTIDDVKQGQTYNWWVHAVNASSTSAQANGRIILTAASSCSNNVLSNVPSGSPIITLGSVSPQLSCNTTQVDLAWPSVSAASAYNLRVNDKADSWISPGQTCADVSSPSDKRGDECVDGIATTSLLYSSYKVSSGHSYDFWVDMPNITQSSLTNFRVPVCPTVVLAPTLTLTAASTTISSGSSTTLRWTTGNAPTSCVASSGWSGSKSISGGTESTGALTSAKTYTLTCSNSAGSVSRSETVSVRSATVVPCESFKYSDWEPCVAGFQSHTLIESEPSGCTIGTSVRPVYSQSCVMPATPTVADITIGQTPNNTTLPRTIENVILHWANTGASVYNLRVDDQTTSGWSGNCSSASPANTGDLCWDGYAGTSFPSFWVASGHTYHFWVDSPSTGSSQSVNFSVAQ